MAVFYHCSCVAHSLVKIAKPGEHPPVVGTFHRDRGVQKRPGFGRGRGPGRTMVRDMMFGDVVLCGGVVLAKLELARAAGGRRPQKSEKFLRFT